MDADLLEELYRKYYRATLLYCTALCGDLHLAQDLTADAFVKAYLSLPEEIPSFRYWLLRVCRNLWYDHCRRQKWTSTDPLPENLTDHRTPELNFLENERRRALWAAISELPPLDRELVTLHYFSGLPLAQISKILGKSHAAVRQRMARLRQKLKQRMEEQGYGP